MALLCNNGISACNGCGYCFDVSLICHECGKALKGADKYYLLHRKAICAECAEKETDENEKCLLCGSRAVGGIAYPGCTLCKDCASSLARYADYI